MIDPSRFALAEHKNQDWVMTVEEGTSLDDVMKPEFMANIASQLRPYDRIRVRIDTGEWYAELLVVDCARTWVHTHKLFYVKFTKEEGDGKSSASPTDEYVVQFRGPHLKFSVLRKSDKSVLQEGMSSKAEANAWLENYLRALLI